LLEALEPEDIERCSHCYTGVGGTSFAAPIWAGFIALANQYAAATGKPPIGFMNPELYRIGADAVYAKAFHDEVAGYNGLYYAEPVSIS
jgi:subtilase family serine protease